VPWPAKVGNDEAKSREQKALAEGKGQIAYGQQRSLYDLREMLELLNSIDTKALIWIHQNLHNAFLDGVFVLLRNKITWLPLYIFLIAFIMLNFGKRGVLWVLFFIFAAALADSVSSKLLKPQVQRVRPCHTEGVAEELHVLISCGGRYGFVSSHATNHFALAAFFFFTIGRLLKKWKWVAILWATCISFAQVYVGVHYPFDVICGAILGCLFGSAIAWYYNTRMKTWNAGLEPEGEKVRR
jgi:undecaprenyl-diphosphatase